jgi:hypothetical protein
MTKMDRFWQSALPQCKFTGQRTGAGISALSSKPLGNVE